MKRILANILIQLLYHSDRALKKNLYLRIFNEYYLARYDSYREQYKLAKSFRFNGENILFYGNGRIECGENSYIGDYSTIQAEANSIVKIGCNCSISHNVRIYTETNFADQDMNHSEPKKLKQGNVSIGDGAWIGANVFINVGVTIGCNVVVGANSVITGDLLENGIYGGVPARLIRMKK